MIRTYISLVLHDWNGCLLDDVPHRHGYGVAPIFRHFGLPVPTIEDYCQNICSDFMNFYYDRGIPRGESKEADAAMLNGIMVSSMQKAPIPPLFPEARSFLAGLADYGVQQVLVSALEVNEFQRQFNHHGLHNHFAEVHGGIRNKAQKFAELMAKYGAKPERTIGVTDSMSDVKALTQAGARAILVPRGYTVPDRTAYPAMHVAEDFHEALKVIIDYGVHGP